MPTSVTLTAAPDSSLSAQKALASLILHCTLGGREKNATPISRMEKLRFKRESALAENQSSLVLGLASATVTLKPLPLGLGSLAPQRDRPPEKRGRLGEIK